MGDSRNDERVQSADQEPQQDEQPRKSYEAPRLLSGDVFEQVVVMSGSGPIGTICSDVRLKTDVTPVDGTTYEHLGLSEYSWTWNAEANRLYGLVGDASGVLAQEVEGVVPAAVKRDVHGYRTVDHALLRSM